MHEHLSDTELARYATDPEWIPAKRRQVVEQETTDCATCRTSLDFFSVVSAEDLADVELWEPASGLAERRRPDDGVRRPDRGRGP